MPTHSETPTNHSSKANLNNLRPYGSLTVCRITSTQPEQILGALTKQVQAQLNSDSRRNRVKDLSVSDITAISGTSLQAISMTWSEQRAAAGFTDNRQEVRQHYVVAASDGTYVAVSTNSPSTQGRILKWIRSDKQGFVTRIPDRTFRALSKGKTAIAAWMRNTTPNRSSQFIAMAVSGDNVGQSAVANDLSSYLANTVRVESPVDENRIEDVTLNANDSKLSFRKTDRIETWADLVDIAFVWLAHAEHAGNHATLLSGTAEIVDSLRDC